MKYDKISIAELLNMDENSIDVRELFYDWFCRDSSLKNKGHKLLQKLRAISSSKKFDATKCYVFFKNNCPLNGSLYDDFRICDIETGEVLFTVVPSIGFKHIKGRALVHCDETGWDLDTKVQGTWRDIKEWFLA